MWQATQKEEEEVTRFLRVVECKTPVGAALCTMSRGTTRQKQAGKEAERKEDGKKKRG
jgi:hypothetical protein